MTPPKFWSREHSGWATFLTPAGALYQHIAERRHARNAARAESMSVPVISVGNVTLGGGGKTPMVQWLCQVLQQRGRTPHVLSRGYGGHYDGVVRVDPRRHSHLDVGDEALLHARHYPVWVARRRADSAAQAVAAGADVLILDDGLQHTSLKKDIEIVMIDGGFGIGNGRVFPAGPLRESWEYAMTRADHCVIVGADMQRLTSRLPRKKVSHAVIRPSAVPSLRAGKKVLAFAGIARPEKFFQSLRNSDIDVVEHFSFPDHYSYHGHDLLLLQEHARRKNLELITTAKDYVRIPPDMQRLYQVFDIALHIDAPAALHRLLRDAGVL